MIIRCGGENLYPREIEEFSSTSKVQEAQVFGIRDARYVRGGWCDWDQIRPRILRPPQGHAPVRFCAEQIAHSGASSTFRLRERVLDLPGHRKIQKFVARAP